VASTQRPNLITWNTNHWVVFDTPLKTEVLTRPVGATAKNCATMVEKIYVDRCSAVGPAMCGGVELSQRPRAKDTREPVLERSNRCSEQFGFWYKSRKIRARICERKKSNVRPDLGLVLQEKTVVLTSTHADHQGQAHPQKGYRNPNITIAIPQQLENIGEVRSSNRRSSSPAIKLCVASNAAAGTRKPTCRSGRQDGKM
jgi:hypothetical protein